MNVSGSTTQNEVANSQGDPSASACSVLSSDASAPASKRRKTVRKYDSIYINLGFTWSGAEDEPRPQCVVCGDVLSNGSMKPSHLMRCVFLAFFRCA